MKRIQIAAAVAAGLMLALSGTPAKALFHLWDFSEIFSSADGTVQFIELHNPTSITTETVATAGQLRSLSTGHVYNFDHNLSGSTANKDLLVATDGFDMLTGGVMPDFTLPANFFNPAGDTVSLFVSCCGTVDSKMFSSLPTDGVMSLNYPGGSAAPNTPTNFAGVSGSVDLSVAPEPSGDYNGNGVVDAADYTVYRDTLGQSVAMDGDGADGDQSGMIDPGDYAYWVERFGNVVPEGSGSAQSAPGDSPGANLAAVPEPATLVAAFVGALIGMFVARCSRS